MSDSGGEPGSCRSAEADLAYMRRAAADLPDFNGLDEWPWVDVEEDAGRVAYLLPGVSGRVPLGVAELREVVTGDGVTFRLAIAPEIRTVFFRRPCR